MFITDEQANARLNSEDNLANRFGKKVEIREEILKQPGRDEGRSNLSIEERTEIATRARLGERQEILAREFNTTQENVSQIKNGKVKGIDQEEVDASIAQVRDKALDRLMHSLGLITNDKLSGCSAKDLSLIASNMGRVVEKTTPKVDGPDRVSFIVFTPELRKETSFETREI